MGVINIWIITDAIFGMDCLERICGEINRSLGNPEKYYMYYLKRRKQNCVEAKKQMMSWYKKQSGRQEERVVHIWGDWNNFECYYRV